MHALRTDRLVEASHLPFEERLTISVRRRISAEDVPPVGDELSADCAIMQSKIVNIDFQNSCCEYVL